MSRITVFNARHQPQRRAFHASPNLTGIWRVARIIDSAGRGQMPCCSEMSAECCTARSATPRRPTRIHYLAGIRFAIDDLKAETSPKP